jgi:hypothetical protein
MQFADSEPGLYVLCVGDTYEIDRTKPWKAMIAEQPIQPTALSALPGNQQMLTSLAQAQAADMEAQVVGRLSL